MIEKAGRAPVVVTVHDLMPVVVLRSPTENWREGWREGLRTRFLRQALKALRQADAYIVGTEWLRHELATWLGNDKNIHVVPFGVGNIDRAHGVRPIRKFLSRLARSCPAFHFPT